MKPRRIAISGYYGFDNSGDEAVLAGLVQSLRSLKGPEELEITALSIAPERTASAHGIAAKHRYRVGPLLSSIANCDLLLSGGGSLLQDVTSAHSIFYYLAVVRIAQILGKKTMFIAQGIGPLNLARSQRLVRSVARKLDAITVRDPGSANLLRAIGVDRPSIEITADPALLLSAPDISANQPTSPPTYAVALRPWASLEGNRLADTVASACRTALPHARPSIVAMQESSDKSIGERFAATYGEAPNEISTCPTWQDTQRVFAKTQLVVGMRLHALILAAACGVPSVALSYDPKVEAFMQSSGQGDTAFALSDLDESRLAQLLEHAWQTRVTRAQDLKTRLPALRASAQKNAEVALGLIF